MRSLAVAGALTLLAACDTPLSTEPDPYTASGELIALSGGDGGAVNACVTCHGLRGEGDSAGAPRLAGLDQGYLLKQLRDYADGRRAHDVMGEVARHLDDRDMLRVSAWYAALPPATATPAGSAPAAGRALYEIGDPERNLPACAACHGDNGLGAPGGPALAGQPTAYLEDQLRRWRVSERRNDPRNLMLEISRAMTEDEVAAVSAYLAALPVGASSPSSSSSTGAMPGSTSSLSMK